MAAISATDIWAVGYFENDAQSLILPLLEHWNGTTWSIVPSPDKNPQKNNPNSLFAVTAASPGDVMAVGAWNSFKKGNPSTLTLTELTAQG